MLSVFETCQPRPEVLSGELKEEIFAARLKDVIDGTAEDVYREPARFFDNTYPTEGLRLLLNEALGRLTGLQPTNNPIIRLETAFGGGKTHNLIALYHTAKGRVSADMVRGTVTPALLPRPGQIQVTGVVGSDLDPTTGLYHPEDDVRTYTLWGELAYQLAGASGYKLAEESDRHRAAPGTGLFQELIGHRPTLIMLDEIARHMRVAQTVPTATGKSDLGEQTVAFLMSLLEFAASRADVVVVLTLAEAGDAFAQETEHLRRQLAEARRISARQERVITPTGETEIAAIVRHRLFSHIDEAAAQEAARFYADAYRPWAEQNVALPQRALRAEYGREIADGYPFHPELLNTLNRKVSTIPNFQKTRGALRLLALVVRQLWQQHPVDTWLIHPHHVSLAAPAIVEDLTSRLERPAFKQVIEADIVSPKAGSPAHAQILDGAWVEAGKAPYARRTATAVFLHSLTQGIASGVDPADLLLAVLSPGDEPLLVHKAAELLYDQGWFFEWDGHRYRFKTEPSLNKIVADEMGMMGRTKAKSELDSRIRQVWKSGVFKVEYFRQEAGEVDDDAGLPKLVVLHYDAATATAAEPTPPELVRKIADYAGALEAYRRFRNNLVFLVADGERVDEMVQTAQRYLAIARITGDAERLAEFTAEQRTKLKKMGEATELDVRVAITRAYRHLYFPSATAPQRDSYLGHDLLPAQEQGEVQKDQSAVVLRALSQQKKLLTGNDSTLAAAYVKSRAWDTNQVSLTTDDLRQAFARRLGLPILLDLNQLKKTILNGVRGQVWVYYDAAAQMGYDHESPPAAVQMSDEAHLYLPEEAARLKLPIRGKEGAEREPEQVCPVCRQPTNQCTCRDEIEPLVRRERLFGEGVPQQALQQLLDRCHDQGVSRLAVLRVFLRGDGKAGARNLRTLGLIVPQLGKGEFEVEQSYNAEFDSGQYISSKIALNWELYRRLKQVTDALAGEASKFVATTTLTLRFPDGLEVQGDPFRTLHEVMTTVGLDRIEIEGEPLEPPAGSKPAGGLAGGQA
ncbi:MAG: ATP-binding protein [Chloroflexota bacterium]